MKHKFKLFSIILILLLFAVLPVGEVSKVQAATLQLNSTSFTLSVNHYKTLYVIGTSKTVTWSSSNTSIATVSSTGKVMAKAPGAAKIYASVSGIKLTSKVTVIKLSSTSTALKVGTSKTLTVYGTSSTVTWSSGNNDVAVVSSSGKITAKAPGTTTIYASVLGKKLTCTVTVVKINAASVRLSVGGKKALKVYGTTSTVTWSSSNKTVAAVSSTGTVTAKAPGSATIYATVLGVKLSSNITVSISSSSKIIGYYAAWGSYSGFTPDKIDASKLTHINYAFANIGSDFKITLGYPDVDSSNISKLNQLKSINPNLKTIISIGGWSWSGRFSDVALTEESRAVFADSCVDFIVKYGFNGIDIDWEYPVKGGLPTNISRPEDKHNFTLLLKTLREKLDAREQIDGKHYILSFAGAAGSWYLSNIEPSQINQYVDYANIMTYDIHGTWEASTNFNAPLYTYDTSQNNNVSVDSSIQGWINSGFPKEKLILGVPFYGYVYKAVSDVNHGLLQSYSGGASISYANIAANYLNAAGYVRYYHTASRVPWLFNGSTFITYEDEESMVEKAKYMKDKGLSGVMIWELSQDPNKVLLNALYQGLN